MSMTAAVLSEPRHPDEEYLRLIDEERTALPLNGSVAQAHPPFGAMILGTCVLHRSYSYRGGGSTGRRS